MNTINWDEIITDESVTTIRAFVNQKISATAAQNQLRGTAYFTPFSRALRSCKAGNLRTRARKALNRRSK